MTNAPALTDVPAQDFLAVDGTGPAGTTAFAGAVEQLYAARFAAGGEDVPLEGLWWSPDAGVPFDLEAPDGWAWTLLVPAPGGASSPPPVRVERLAEGRAAEVLHVGPHDAEAPTIATLHAFIAAQGLRPHGRHHEIYLDDPRTTGPAMLRTILRQPVR